MRENERLHKAVSMNWLHGLFVWRPTLEESLVQLNFSTVQAYPEGAIAYYNSGEDAGASQPRKHLQILPASLDGHSTAPLPFESVIQAEFRESGATFKEALALHQLPFQSFGAVLPERWLSAVTTQRGSKQYNGSLSLYSKKLGFCAADLNSDAWFNTPCLAQAQS